MGYISQEEIVFNKQGKQLGFNNNGSVHDAEGNPLEKARKDGWYYNKDGVSTLHVKGQDEKCEILIQKDINGYCSQKL